MKETRLLFVAAAAALLLAACGGGAGAPDTAESQMQRDDRAASASIGGLIGFAKSQIASTTSDSALPRDIDAIDPPRSDTAEPLSL